MLVPPAAVVAGCRMLWGTTKAGRGRRAWLLTCLVAIACARDARSAGSPAHKDGGAQPDYSDAQTSSQWQPDSGARTSSRPRTDSSDGGSSAQDAHVSAPPGRPSPIAGENALPGTGDWKLQNAARKHEVEGYASLTSAQSGQRVTLYVTVDHPMAVRWDLFRMGYYQGLGGRLISSGAPKMVAPQPPCAAQASTGWVECAWDAAFEVDIASDWVTGQYFFKLTADDGHESLVPLVVREADRRAEVLFQSSVTTWQAYNVYGGSSLYRNFLPQELGFRGSHANVVSFDRPYTCQDLEDPNCTPGAGDFEVGERWMGSWLEQRGVDVAYVTNLDVEADPQVVMQRKLFLSVGHDEYWSVTERDALEAARDAGVSLGFFAANTGYWRVRIDASRKGTPRRSIICYKVAANDPVTQSQYTTAEFRTAPLPRPESSLLGVMYDDSISRTYIDNFGQIVRMPEHWIYAGTSVRNGERLSHVVGHEWDHVHAMEGSPAHVEIVAHAELFNVSGMAVPADVTLYYPTPSSLVFAAGSVRWAQGLARPGNSDPRIQRMTENLLARVGVKLVGDKTVVTPQPESTTPPLAAWAGSGEAGSRDGSREQAQFDAPVGLAAGPDGEVYVADVNSHAVRMVASDGSVSTLAGCGAHQFRDGDGRAACFDHPTGIVRAPDGTLYVADTGNARIRALTKAGHVTTFAGTGKRGTDDTPDRLTATFSDPRGLALAADGTLYVGESGSGRVRMIAPSGAVSTIAQVGQATGLVVAADGTLYIVDTRTGTIAERRPDLLHVIAGGDGIFGDLDGLAEAARLRPGEGIVLDGDRLVFTDAANHKLRAVLLAQGRAVVTLAGSDSTTRDLELPRGVVATAKGFVVSDSGHHRLVLIPR
jgi:hypothetical protein